MHEMSHPWNVPSMKCPIYEMSLEYPCFILNAYPVFRNVETVIFQKMHIIHKTVKFSLLCHKFFLQVFFYWPVVNALIHKLLSDPYQSRYNSQTINTKTQAGSHRLQCQHGHKLSKRSIFQLMCIYRYMIHVKLIYAFTGFEQIYIILVKLIPICS